MRRCFQPAPMMIRYRMTKVRCPSPGLTTQEQVPRVLLQIEGSSELVCTELS